MSDQINLDVIQRIYDAFNRGDIATSLDSLDPQAELVYEGPSTIPWAGTRRGRDEWIAFFQTVGENLDEAAVQMQPFAAQGDQIAASGRYQARVKSTGQRIDSPLVHLWTMRNGKIARCVELTNTAGEVAALTGVAV